MSPTRELADFLADSTPRIHEHLIRGAVTVLVDTVGCMFYGATKPWSRAAIIHALDTGGEGSATVIGAGTETTPAMAAFANGSSCSRV